jgi:hypothetical protein
MSMDLGELDEPTPSQIIEGTVLIGFRSWNLKIEQGSYNLAPIGSTQHHKWIKGVNKAVCKSAKHQAPDRTHGCGLYGVFDPDSRASYGNGAFGAIAVWGDIEVHPTGFRAQYAQIIAISPIECDPEQVKAIADIYECMYFPEKRQVIAEAKKHGVMKDFEKERRREMVQGIHQPHSFSPHTYRPDLRVGGSANPHGFKNKIQRTQKRRGSKYRSSAGGIMVSPEFSYHNAHSNHIHIARDY